MIIWINGTFGVGKTHTAYELQRRIENSFLYDPELVGFFLRKNLPDGRIYDDFQKIPLWKNQVADNLIYCDKVRNITIVPMTLVDDEIFDFIFSELKKNNVDVRHYALVADKITIEQRLIKRGDKNTWAYNQVERCLSSLPYLVV